MVEIGDYKVGYVTNDAFEVDVMHCGISYKDKLICSFPSKDGKEITRLMMLWFNLNAVNELSDTELIAALRERGYSGKLSLAKEIEV